MSNNQATIEDLIDEMYDVLDKGWKMPLSAGKVFVDGEEVRQILDEIKDEIPAEVRQAKAIVNDRAEIISTAKKEAASIVKKAEDKARAIVNQDDLTKAAQQKAAEIISQAQMQAREMRQAATEFADNLMKSTEQFLVASMEEVKETRTKLRGRKK